MIRDTDIEMLKMLSEGHPQKTIAAAISWSPSAVHRRLRERVYPALGAVCAAQAVFQAVRAGLIECQVMRDG